MSDAEARLHGYVGGHVADVNGHDVTTCDCAACTLPRSPELEVRDFSAELQRARARIGDLEMDVYGLRLERDAAMLVVEAARAWRESVKLVDIWPTEEPLVIAVDAWETRIRDLVPTDGGGDG